MKISVGIAGNNKVAAIVFNVFIFHSSDDYISYKLKFLDRTITMDELFDSNSNTFHLNIQNLRQSFKSVTVIGKELSKYKTTK